MENYKKPLLSIAIPTYNRANILDIALQKLLPQIEEFKENIELIISDNASTDNTNEIINSNLSKFNLPLIKLNTQPYNTGYYGNFKKCKELSEGVYFWLLSDNDHLEPEILKIVIEQLKSKKEIGAIYLHSTKINENYEVLTKDFDLLNEEHSDYALMLISALVLYNEKKYDDIIFNEYKGNTFLGFLFFANSLQYSKKIVIISGKIFNGVQTTVSFDIFHSWTHDISACISYMEKNKIINTKTKNYLITGYLKRVVYYHVYHYIVKKKLYGKSYGSIENIRRLLNFFYSNNNYYNLNIYKLFKTPRLLLIIKYYYNVIRRRIYKQFI